ncbi:MAG: hypothetical protein IIA88_04900, partial [Bacteroidetes bacterium]|nr:hypothetical protein [Bacteroidota bacterium]
MTKIKITTRTVAFTQVALRIGAYLTVLLLVAGGSSPFRGSGGAGGNTKIDSLKTVIQTASHDTTKIKALNELGGALMYS